MKKPIDLLIVEHDADSIRAAQEHFKTVEHITATFARTYVEVIALLESRRYDAAIINPDFPRNSECAPERLGPELAELMNPDGKYRVPYTFFTETVYQTPSRKVFDPKAEMFPKEAMIYEDKPIYNIMQCAETCNARMADRKDLVGHIVEFAADLDTFSGFRMPLKNDPYAWKEAYRIFKNIFPEYWLRQTSQKYVKQSLRRERDGETRG